MLISTTPGVRPTRAAAYDPSCRCPGASDRPLQVTGAAPGRLCELGTDIGYTAIDVTEESLPAFMESVRAEPGWRGLSVTMPLKKAMVREVDEVRGVAQVLGVINTVVFECRESGRRVGYNTDVAGIVNALRNAGAVEAPAAVVLGGGGTAAAAVAALQELGARSVAVYVRDTGRAAEARAAATGLAMEIAVRPISEAVAALAGADVVISTLPPRAADGMAAELEVLGHRTDGVLLDVAYDPWPSRIAAVWEAAAEQWLPAWRCCCTRRWSRSGSLRAATRPPAPKS